MRKYDECPEDPVEMTALIGRYRCPTCGCHVLAQMPHSAHERGCWLGLDKKEEKPEMNEQPLF